MKARTKNTNQNERRKKKAADKPTSKTEATPEMQPLQVDVFTAPTRETVKPALQLSLTEAELEEEIPQMLTANNPQAPQNVARFHPKERCFKLEAMVEQCITHYSTDGWLLSKNSEEGKKQLETERLQEEAMAKLQGEVGTQGDSASAEMPDDSKQLRNQFNFSDRACQTSNLAPKERGCYTEPPQTTTRNGSCSQWEIYDDYRRDIEAQRLQALATKKRSAATTKKTKPQDEAERKADETQDDAAWVERGVSIRAAKVVERMTVQNVFDELNMDLKYWDDDSDAFRPKDASLLPLWKFHDEHSVGKPVTAICFNSKHSDAFAVGYGSDESRKQIFGLVCIYSIKNPTVPETHIVIESSVLALAFHPEFPNLIGLGCYDGSVRIIDAKGETLYVSDGVSNRPNEPVWQLFWKKEAGSGELQLYSASTDGTLGLWTFTRSEVIFEPIMNGNHKDSPDGMAPGFLSMDFNPLEDACYVVGTEEGHVHRCSTDYGSEYLDSYAGHELPVYAVKWNQFHSEIFLSASEDWTILLWDAQVRKHAIMRFELNSPVTDVAWAPFASTIFAAVTASGHIFVFDVSTNRHAAICEQKVIAKGKLTKIIFHPRQPFILVGDTTGLMTSFKLSPNLRKYMIDGSDEKENLEKERSRLDTVLNIARKSAV